MKMSRNVLIFFVLNFSLFPEMIRDQIWQWKGVNIYWFYDTIDPEKRGIEFQATRKNITSQTFYLAYETLLQKGEYKVDRKNFFYTISQSAGESGGTLFLRIYYPHKKKLNVLVLETTGYAEFKFVDFDFSGNEEIFTQNTEFYGISFQTKNEKACIQLPPVYVSGLNPDYIFPRYYKIADSETRGIFKLIEVTFTPQAEYSLKPYFQKIERFLQNHKNSVISDPYMIPVIFQYYNYMKKLGNEKEALLKLKNSRIRFESTCNSKKKTKTYLELLVLEYFKQNQ